MGFDNVNVNVSGPVQPTSTYKTKVLKGNHSFASQVTEPNMKYVIKHDFVLDDDVTIPENCILEFDGGSITNATGNEYIITCNNTILSGKVDTTLIEGTYSFLNTVTYNTVADMKNSSQTFGFAKTLGYYAKGDGGGVFYIIKDSSDRYVETLTNGFVAELITGNTNVLSYGAKADATGAGGTDNKTAFVAMLDNERCLKLPAQGRFYISGGLILDKQYTTIIGVDSYIIIDEPIHINADYIRFYGISLRAKAGTERTFNCFEFEKYDDQENMMDIFVFQFDSSKIFYFDKAFYLKKYVSQMWVTNSSIYSCNYVLYNEWIKAGAIEFNITFQNCFIYGTQVQLASIKLVRALFDNCYIEAHANNFIYSDFNSILKFRDCEIEIEQAITVTGDSFMFKIQDACYFERCNLIGNCGGGNLYWFRVTPNAKYVSLSDCQFYDKDANHKMKGIFFNSYEFSTCEIGMVEMVGCMFNYTTKLNNPRDCGLWNTCNHVVNFTDGAGISLIKGLYDADKLLNMCRYSLWNDSPRTLIGECFAYNNVLYSVSDGFPIEYNRSGDSTIDLPTIANGTCKGFKFWAEDLNEYLIWDGWNWRYPDSVHKNARYNGTFNQKPSSVLIKVGFKYFCTDRKIDMDSSSPTYMQIIIPVSPDTGGMEIYFKGRDTTDPQNPVDIWVDAFGRVVS